MDGGNAAELGASVPDLAGIDFASGFQLCPVPTSRFVGIVWIESPHALAVPKYPASQPRAQVGAGFKGAASEVTLDRCPCFAEPAPFERNQLDMSQLPDAGARELPNAGPITIAGGGRALSLEPGLDGLYRGENPGAYFVPGDSIEVSAAGAAIPGFKASVNAPRPVHIVAPAAGASLQRAKGEAVPVTWQGGQAGEAVVVDVIVPVFEDVWQVRCLFEASAGAGVIPASILDDIPYTWTNEAQRMSAATVSIATAARNEWSIEIRAGTPALASAGVEWNATLMPR